MELDVGTEQLLGTSVLGFEGGFVEVELPLEMATSSEVSLCTTALDGTVNRSVTSPG